jgi:tyrosine-protein phosphatase YwqE
LLPGIDDGARTFEDSLRLTQALQSFGITQIITTLILYSMFGTTPSRNSDFGKDTTAKLATANISIPFKAAAEYLMDDQFISFPDE